MQVVTDEDVAVRLDEIVTAEIPRENGLAAWSALLVAHATLVRRLETDLEREAGLALADFDVLAQLALAGGQLRMSELADRALISRSGMTRRVGRLVGEGLVRRDSTSADARGITVTLTAAGETRLLETAPIHARGVAQLFVSRLNDDELHALEDTLGKVKVDCSFG